jgi:cytochrome c556
MKRLDQAQQQGILPLLASSRDFERGAAGLLHDAQVVAALAEVITREGFEFADDEAYLEYARAMRQQAQTLRDATLGGNYGEARQAAALLAQSCTNCHEDYRSQ